MLLTVLHTNTSSITQQVLEDVISDYTAQDDVFCEAFLQGVYISSSVPKAEVDRSAIVFLTTLGVEHIIADPGLKLPFLSPVSRLTALDLPPGPYFATRTGKNILLSKVYRLYEDTYRTFLYGTFEAGDGSGAFTALDSTSGSVGTPAIPVPSRLYSVNDARPFAGYRVAVKDLFDMRGLITSGGSKAWTYISSPATETAPSIQRIIDLGGVIVGKQKLTQFASGADPWDWQDVPPPFNPRGDGWLTCSASSSGGGCGIAAYECLDFAIGTDIGSSMRKPAAVAGVYGQRPSQDMMALEGVMPQGGATDTAGVFARHPLRWVHFSRHWYGEDSRQDTAKTGLSELSIPESSKPPKTLLYPIDYSPDNNPAAQAILEAFIANVAAPFNMEVKPFNFTATVQNAAERDIANLSARNGDVLNIINYHPRLEEVAQPLINTWADLFDGAFPPVDPAFRGAWANWEETGSTMEQYERAVRLKRASAEWYEQTIQYQMADQYS